MAALKTKYTRKLTRQGSHSYYILLPPALVKTLNWRERQKLTLKKSGQKIVIGDWKKN